MASLVLTKLPLTRPLVLLLSSRSIYRGSRSLAALFCRSASAEICRLQIKHQSRSAQSPRLGIGYLFRKYGLPSYLTYDGKTQAKMKVTRNPEAFSVHRLHLFSSRCECNDGGLERLVGTCLNCNGFYFAAKDRLPRLRAKNVAKNVQLCSLAGLDAPYMWPGCPQQVMR